MLQEGNVAFFNREGGATAVLKGEVDHHHAAEFRRCLDDYICRKRPSVLWLDVSGVSFMDSSGLGLLMGRYALLKRAGGELVLYRPSDEMMRIIRLAGMERILKIVKKDS